MEVLFCTKEDIVRRSPILDGNLDADRIIPALHLSQTQYLREIIGTKLYEKYGVLITALATNGTAIPPVYLNLLNDYIKPILIHLATSEFLKSGGVTVSNKGIYMHSSENSTNLTSEEIKELVQIERDRAQSYTERFLDWMAFNATTNNITEWYSNSNADVSPNYESYNIDFVL